MAAGVSGGAPRGKVQVQEDAAEVAVGDGAFNSVPAVVDILSRMAPA